MPGLSTTGLDRPLTQRYNARLQEAEGYVGVKGAAIRNVDAATNVYQDLVTKEVLSLDEGYNPTLSLGSKDIPRPRAGSMVQQTIRAGRYADMWEATEDEEALFEAQGTPFRTIAVNDLAELAAGVFDYHLGSFLSTAANYDSSMIDASFGDITTSSTAVVKTLQDIANLLLRKSGRKPNRLAINHLGLGYMLALDEIQDKYAQLQKAGVTAALGDEAALTAVLRQYKGLERIEVVVFERTYETGGTDTWLMPSGEMAIYYTDPMPGVSFANVYVPRFAANRFRVIDGSLGGIFDEKQTRAMSGGAPDKRMIIADAWYTINGGAATSKSRFAGYRCAGMGTWS